MSRKLSTVKRGKTGVDVYICQALLRALFISDASGKPLEIDGVCGSKTVEAINRFQSMQRAYGIECGTNGKNDGSFGKACWSRVLGV